MDAVTRTNNGDTIHLMLLSLIYQIPQINVVKIFDNGDISCTANENVRSMIDILRKNDIRVEIRRDKWKGGLQSFKYLFKWAKGAHFLFMDDDVILSPNTLELLYQTMSIQHIGGVVPTLINANNSPHYPDYIDEPQSEIVEYSWRCTMQFIEYKIDGEVSIPYCSSGCMLLNREKSLDAIDNIPYKEYDKVIPADDIIFTYNLAKKYKICMRTSAKTYLIPRGEKKGEYQKFRQSLSKIFCEHLEKEKRGAYP